MARRPAIVKRKPKTVRTTKSEQYIVNQKYLGDEPTFTGDNPSTVDYVRALSWYNYMATSSEAKDYLKEYLKKVGSVDDAKAIGRLPDSQIPMTAAFLARMMCRGYKPTEESKKFLWIAVKTAIANVTTEDNSTDDSDTPRVSIQDRMREKTHEIIGEVEGHIDEYIHHNLDFSLYTWLQSNGVPAAYASSIIAKLAPVLDELIEAYDGEDSQLKEGYRSYKKSEIKRLINFYNTMCEDAAKYANVTKKTRAPRKPRVQSVEKKLKSFKYQKEDNTFKIASVNPEKIIGAQELWTFNTKYKTLSVFRALDRGGLDVKGTSIIKYNEETSFTMRTGRNPHEAIKKVTEGGKILLRKIDQELKNHAPLQSRINENTILLRVI